MRVQESKIHPDHPSPSQLDWEGSRRKLLTTAIGAIAGGGIISGTIYALGRDKTSNAIDDQDVASPPSPDLSPSTPTAEIEQFSFTPSGPIEFPHHPELIGFASLQDHNVFIDFGEVHRILFANEGNRVIISVLNAPDTTTPLLNATTEKLNGRTNIVSKGKEKDSVKINGSYTHAFSLYPHGANGSLLTVTINGQEASVDLHPFLVVTPDETSDVVLYSDKNLGEEATETVTFARLINRFLSQDKLKLYARKPLSSYGEDAPSEDKETAPKTGIRLNSEKLASPYSSGQERVRKLLKHLFNNIHEVPQARDHWAIVQERFDILRNRFLDQGVALIDPETNTINKVLPTSLAAYLLDPDLLNGAPYDSYEPFTASRAARCLIENFILYPEEWENKWKQLNFEDPTYYDRSDQEIISYFAAGVYNTLTTIDPIATRQLIPALKPWNDDPDNTWIKLGDTHIFDTDARTEFLLREMPTPVPRPSIP